MNFISLIVVVASMSLLSQATVQTIYLRNDNFDEIINTSNFFVVFVKDRPIPEFDSFYDKVAQLYNPDKKSEIKIGKVVCTNNSKVCQDQEIGDELLTLRYYAQEGKRFDYEAMANFFTSTIAVHVKNFLLEEATALKIRSGNNFVKFTVPYCGHCKKMAPTWIELENEFKDDPEVSILSVDCKKHKDICNNFNVSGYPSLIWIEDGKRIDKYPGRRNLPDFKKYIDKMHKTTLTAAPNVEPTARESAVLDLTTRDFEKAISSDFSFVYFFLPFCSHCAEIQAVWNELAKKFTSSTNVKIARVNCQSNQEICFREVKGCPTLNIYSEGEKALSDYYEDMSLDGLVDAISSHAKGGEDLHDWRVRNQEKRRLRRAQKKKDKKAKALAA